MNNKLHYGIDFTLKFGDAFGLLSQYITQMTTDIKGFNTVLTKLVSANRALVKVDNLTPTLTEGTTHSDIISKKSLTNSEATILPAGKVSDTLSKPTQPSTSPKSLLVNSSAITSLIGKIVDQMSMLITNTGPKGLPTNHPSMATGLPIPIIGPIGRSVQTNIIPHKLRVDFQTNEIVETFDATSKSVQPRISKKSSIGLPDIMRTDQIFKMMRKQIQSNFAPPKSFIDLPIVVDISEPFRSNSISKQALAHEQEVDKTNIPTRHSKASVAKEAKMYQSPRLHSVPEIAKAKTIPNQVPNVSSNTPVVAPNLTKIMDQYGLSLSKTSQVTKLLSNAMHKISAQANKDSSAFSNLGLTQEKVKRMANIASITLTNWVSSIAGLSTTMFAATNDTRGFLLATKPGFAHLGESTQKTFQTDQYLATPTKNSFDTIRAVISGFFDQIGRGFNKLFVSTETPWNKILSSTNTLTGINQPTPISPSGLPQISKQGMMTKEGLNEASFSFSGQSVKRKDLKGFGSTAAESTKSTQPKMKQTEAMSTNNGTANRSLTINKLVETLIIKVEQLPEAKERIRDAVAEALLLAINDYNLAH